MRRAADALRRADAVIVGAFGLVILSPVLLAVAIAVRIDMGSPVLFRQRRLGLGGRPFEMV
ncbi:MAG TPA: sugar transferase, partial [Ilumatobacteraceae bacterium]|nr:sugar transferase [Ilumatobacteraceae bacterium]